MPNKDMKSIKDKDKYEAIRREHPELGKEGAARIANSQAKQHKGSRK